MTQCVRHTIHSNILCESVCMCIDDTRRKLNQSLTNHCVNLAHVVFHFIFTCIICNPIRFLCGRRERERERLKRLIIRKKVRKRNVCEIIYRFAHTAASMQISIHSLSNISGCHHLLTVHDTLWLIIYNFAIAFTFPCTFVLFECIISAIDGGRRDKEIE